jgi:argininosuccinate lyase
MKQYLWKPGAYGDVDETITQFLAGEDVVLDRELFPFDIEATVAHVRGLARIGILGETESNRLVELLQELLQEFEAGQFALDERYEDGHSAIEIYLTDKAGEAGAKVHTGRADAWLHPPPARGAVQRGAVDGCLC